jgi:hypothetical protein
MAENAAPAWFAEDFVLPASTSTLENPVAGQTVTIAPRIGISGYRFRPKLANNPPLHQLVLVNLADTVVSPGRLLVDQNDKRGAFTELVDVRIWFENEKRLLVKQAFPDTSIEGGSASQSVSYSLGPGMMGHMPMFNANWSISAGVTQAIPDFEILKNVGVSGGAMLEHSYRLRLVSGNVYGGPQDIVDTGGVKGSIRELPAKARSDFNLVSSVLFFSREEIKATPKLKIRIAHRTRFVEKTLLPIGGVLPDPIRGLLGAAADLALGPYDMLHPEKTQAFTLSGWLGSIVVVAVPFIHHEEWTFQVDLKSDNGGVTLVK